jgi:hypothetical protein
MVREFRSLDRLAMSTTYPLTGDAKAATLRPGGESLGMPAEASGTLDTDPMREPSPAPPRREPR